jgi:hypothetical protein
MRRLTLLTLAGLAWCVMAVTANAQDTTTMVKSDTRPFIVKYSDGRIEQYVAEWVGTVHNMHWESGGPAVPFSGHFVDDRTCHWELTPKITRKLYLVNANGERFAKEGLMEPYGATFANQGASFKVIGLRSENCGDADARYRSDVNNANVHLASKWETTIDSDFQQIMNEVKGWQKVVTITVISASQPAAKQN